MSSAWCSACGIRCVRQSYMRRKHQQKNKRSVLSHFGDTNTFCNKKRLHNYSFLTLMAALPHFILYFPPIMSWQYYGFHCVAAMVLLLMPAILKHAVIPPYINRQVQFLEPPLNIFIWIFCILFRYEMGKKWACIGWVKSDWRIKWNEICLTCVSLSSLSPFFYLPAISVRLENLLARTPL